jgi:energy-coupling factor transporter ATP-binding protein EcfA2
VQYFRIAGLTVGSDLPLPQMTPVTASASAADIHIRRGSVPQTLPRADAVGPTWEIAGDHFLLRVPGVARFLLLQGRDIIFEPCDQERTSDIAVFLTGTVFGILLHQRRQTVLHASAVNVGGKAVLFCGTSGAGKSTMAAALGTIGYPLLNDDISVIGRDGEDVPVTHSDGRQLKLWQEAADALGLTDRLGAPVRDGLSKHYVTLRSSIGETLPIGAVYMLREAEPSRQSGIARLNIADAAHAIIANAYRPILVAAMNQKSLYLQSAMAISKSAGVFLLTRQKHFAGISDIVGGLERHWREHGLLA